MRCEEKIPNGKMMAIEVETENGLTSRVRITGDFFLHPEDALDAVERSLTGIPADEDALPLIKRSLEGASLIGATAEDIARIFRKAIS